MTNSENTLAPAEGPGAGAPAPIEATRAALDAAKTPADAKRVEAAAKALKELAVTLDPAQANDVAVEGADLQFRAGRLVGELLPGEQGKRNDLGTSGGTQPKFEATQNALKTYRRLAKIPADLFEATLADHRRRREPVTQTALLKLLPKPEKPDRQVSHLVWLGALLERTGKAISKRLETAKGTPEALDVRQVALVIEEIGRRIDARLEDGGPSEIDLRLLGEPDPNAGDQGDEDQDDEDADEADGAGEDA